MKNLLENPGFEAGWWRRTAGGQEFGEIFVPEGWVAYWRDDHPVPHDPANQVGYSRPEMHVINREVPFLDPPRVRSGSRAVKYFTFYRIHDAGLYQQVRGVEPGSRVRGSGWAHAWSSTQDDPYASEGVGKGPFFVLASEYRQETETGVRNFTFTVGIDPYGGTDPWADTVVWGEGAHIYNAYAQIPPVETVAYSDVVTFFVRSSVLWPFKHCDAYLDDMSLGVVAGPPRPIRITVTPDYVVAGRPFEVRASGGMGPADLTVRFRDDRVFWMPPQVDGDSVVCRCVAIEPARYDGEVVMGIGETVPFTVDVAAPEPAEIPGFIPPREQYVRTYLLLPPDAGDAWLAAVQQSGVWERYRWTIGSSADDAGMGPAQRRVVAINPEHWPGDLKAFFDEHYPGVTYFPVRAATPAELLAKLRGPGDTRDS